MKHPMQPLVAKNETLRFKQNAIINYLFESGKMDLNAIACMPFDAEDRMQLAQLLGYSLSGYGDLSFVTNESYETARTMYDEGITDTRDARIATLEMELFRVRAGMRDTIAHLYGLHPDDLNIHEPKDHNA